jgi:hypothetical protein
VIDELAIANGWMWNSQAPPPLTGQVRTDSRAWLGATKLHVDKTSDGGVDATTVLTSIKIGDVVRLEHQTDASRYAEFLAAGPGVLTVNAYVITVTYRAGGGTIPLSGTRVLLQLLPAASTVILWSITAARDPSRFWITTECLHGRVAELVASWAGAPAPGQVVPTTALNLHRRIGCTCVVLSPAIAVQEVPPQPYVFADIAGYQETWQTA